VQCRIHDLWTNAIAIRDGNGSVLGHTESSLLLTIQQSLCSLQCSIGARTVTSTVLANSLDAPIMMFDCFMKQCKNKEMCMKKE
jgi:hypothetical protein